MNVQNKASYDFSFRFQNCSDSVVFFVFHIILNINATVTVFSNRFVKIHERLRKAVSSLDFFTSNEWQFTNDNLYILLNKLTPEDKKVIKCC